MSKLGKIIGYKVYSKKPGNKTWKLAFSGNTRKRCMEYINSPHSRQHTYLLCRVRKPITGQAFNEPLIELAR